MAKTGSARRHCQGPKAARTGAPNARFVRVGVGACAVGAKWRALHGAEHRSSIDCVMVGAFITPILVGTLHIPKETTIAPSTRAAFGCVVGRGSQCTSVIRISRTNGTRLSGGSGPRSAPTSPAQITARRDPDGTFIDSDTDSCSHGVSDPSGHARGHWTRAHRGRSRHGYLPLIAAGTLAVGRQRAPPIVRSVRAFGRNLQLMNLLLASRVRNGTLVCRGGKDDQGRLLGGTTSISEVVPKVVLCCWSQATSTRGERWRYCRDSSTDSTCP